MAFDHKAIADQVRPLLNLLLIIVRRADLLPHSLLYDLPRPPFLYIDVSAALRAAVRSPGRKRRRQQHARFVLEIHGIPTEERSIGAEIIVADLSNLAARALPSQGLGLLKLKLRLPLDLAIRRVRNAPRATPGRREGLHRRRARRPSEQRHRQAHASPHGRSLKHALILLLQGGDGAVARELGGVVELVDVCDAARVQGVFEQADDGGLQRDDLPLQLVLRDGVALCEAVAKPPVISLVLLSDVSRPAAEAFSEVVVAQVGAAPFHVPIGAVVGLRFLFLDLVDFFLEGFDFVILAFVGALLLSLFADALVKVHARREGADYGGYEGRDDEGFLARASV